MVINLTLGIQKSFWRKESNSSLSTLSLRTQVISLKLLFPIALYLVEEFYYAALEIKQMEWAKLFLQIIGNKIPQSPKHMRLLAMFHEAIQDFDKAKEIYNELISLNGSDFQTVKRLVALERDRGKINEAIILLNKYLENNQQDNEAWLELTDLFLSKHNYEKAQFCYEEILSLNPANYYCNIRYAEILYSAGSDNLDNLYHARKYYSHALTL